MIRSTDTDPAGGLVVELGSGEDTLYIRTSSKVLSLASSVFAAMLSLIFFEGGALAASSAGSTTNIALPEDDPEAAVWLRDALRFKKNIAKDMSFKLLTKLAVICDKYDMSNALSPWIYSWMERRKTDMVWISYAFGHHAAFWRNSKNMTLHSSPEFLEIGGNIIFPDGVIDAIGSNRSENVVPPASNPREHHNATPPSRLPCQKAARSMH